MPEPAVPVSTVPVSVLRPAGEPPGDREVVLEAANVSREFGGVRAVNGVSFTHLPAYRRARLGLVRTFQVASEFKRLTVGEGGGERKMLAMGRVLMLEPSVFLLDEPTANLAPAIARSLLEEHVRSLAQGGALIPGGRHL